jgi:hypothetical protein
MPNPNRVRTSDPIFANSLLTLLGQDAELPDGQTIRAIIHAANITSADTLYDNTYSQFWYAKIPTRELATLEAGQVVTYDGKSCYAPTLQPTAKGWSVFTLEPQ